MGNSTRLSIPLIAPLIPDGLRPGTMLLMEFDPEAKWFALARTIIASWVQSGSRALYAATTCRREDVIDAFTRLGVSVHESEEAGLLRIDDYYSATLSLDQTVTGTRVVDDKYVRVGSLKIADLSVDWLKQIKGARLLSKWTSDQTGVLTVAESFSPFLRFNEEKPFLEWMESRNLPLNRGMGRINIVGMLRRLHSESFYTRLENAFDGILEIRVMEREDEVKNLVRVRSLKEQPHDSRWHEVKVNSNAAATLVSQARMTNISVMFRAASARFVVSFTQRNLLLTSKW